MSSLKQSLQKFLHNLATRNFAEAQQNLRVVVESKMKQKIEKEKDNMSKKKAKKKPVKKAAKAKK